MSRKAVKSASPARPAAGQLLICLGLLLFTLWQGSYFPVQFLLMLALLLALFLAGGRSLRVNREALMLLAIPVIYLLSTALLSAQPYAGLTEAMRALALPLCLLLFLNRPEDSHTEDGIMVALMAVAVIGLLAYWGIITIPGGVIEGSGRLQSVIQYANTTALLMTIGALYALERLRVGRQLGSLISLLVFLGTLWLTGSRTSLVVAMLALALYGLMLAGRRGRIIIAAALAGAVALVLLLGQLLPTRILQLSLLAPTLVERWITFGDALGMLKGGKWLTGIGAGSWQVLQYSLQSAPYSVKFIHNHYLQLLLDGGIVALGLFVAALVPSAVRGVRQQSFHGCILAAVLLHITLDFDLTFAGVAMITAFSLSRVCRPGPVIRPGKARLAALVPLALVVCLLSSEVMASLGGRSLDQGRLDSAMARSRAAMALNPLYTGMRYQMAQSTRDLALTEGLLLEAVAADPYDLPSLEILTRMAQSAKDWPQALDYGQRLLAARPLSEDYQALYSGILAQSLMEGAITEALAREELDRLDQINAGLNPLYINYIQ